MDFAFTVKGIHIETERLTLSEWTEEDLADFYRYASVPGVGEMAGWPHHEDIETSRRILRGFLLDGDVFKITDKATGRVIGSLGVHRYEEPGWEERTDKIREIGYVLAKDMWGRGLMPEAVSAVVEYLFRNTDAESLAVCHFHSNDQSRRVIEKCGFRYVRETEFDARAMGKRILSLEYVLKKEWHLLDYK